MTDIELRYPVNALVSFHYYARKDIGELHRCGLRLIGDSGAFSALTQGTPIPLPAFADWATQWRDDLAWVASLDVIGDPEASWVNYLLLRNRGVDAVPTVHYGSDPSLLDRYADDGVDFVGLGGMVGFKGEADRLLRWCLRMFRYAKDKHPNMRFHGWGVTHDQLLLSLPWYSVDSSGFGQAYRYGRARLWHPQQARFHRVALDGREAHVLRDLLRDHYGTTPETVATSSAANRRQLIRLMGRSAQLYEDYLRTRHQVTSPSYGLRHPATGTNVHFVDGSYENVKQLGTNLHMALASKSEAPALAKESA